MNRRPHPPADALRHPAVNHDESHSTFGDVVGRFNFRVREKRKKRFRHASQNVWQDIFDRKKGFPRSTVTKSSMFWHPDDHVNFVKKIKKIGCNRHFR